MMRDITSYSCSAEISYERLENYDKANAEFPADEIWYKPNFEYECSVVGEQEYAKITLPSAICEFWYEAGTLVQLRCNGVTMDSFPVDVNAEYELFRSCFFSQCDGTNLLRDVIAQYSTITDNDYYNTIAAARAETIIGIQIINFMTCEISLKNLSSGGWRDFAFDDNVDSISGYGENLEIVWKDVEQIVTENMCVDLKKGELVMLELYREIQVPKNVVTQEDCEKWRGDWLERSSVILTFQYPDENTVISIPQRS